MHLDPDSVARLQARDPDTVAHFRTHLGQSCPTCEEYLAGPDRALEWLDAEVDRLLFIHAAPGAAEDLSGYGSVRRRLRRGRTAWALGAFAGLAAASLAAVVVAGVVAGDRTPAADDGTNGVKGVGVQGTSSLELSAVAVDAEGKATPLSPGGTVSASASVLLRYRAAEPAQAFLVVEGSGGRVRALGRFSLAAGVADLGDGQGPAAVSMAGESGRVTLWLVRGAGGPAEAEALVKAQGEGRALGPGVRLTSFPVSVVH